MMPGIWILLVIQTANVCSEDWPSQATDTLTSTNRTFDPYMPIVVGGAIVGGIGLAVASGIHTSSGQLSAFGAVCYAAVIAITVPTCLRINKQVAR
jgi:hypothetical protein